MNAKATTVLQAFDRLPAGAVVVEIGCVRFPSEISSDGYSTVHLARAATERRWVFHSVDIDPDAVEIAQAATEGLAVTVHCASGADWLGSCGLVIDGLYLDGAAEPEQAVAQYRVAELSGGAVIVIDDIQPIGLVERGKGDLLLDVLEADGWTVAIMDTEPGYRMAVATR